MISQSQRHREAYERVISLFEREKTRIENEINAENYHYDVPSLDIQVDAANCAIHVGRSGRGGELRVSYVVQTLTASAMRAQLEALRTIPERMREAARRRADELDTIL